MDLLESLDEAEILRRGTHFFVESRYEDIAVPLMPLLLVALLEIRESDPVSAASRAFMAAAERCFGWALIIFFLLLTAEKRPARSVNSEFPTLFSRHQSRQERQMNPSFSLFCENRLKSDQCSGKW